MSEFNDALGNLEDFYLVPRDHFVTVRKSLKISDKLLQEPSEAMCDAARYRNAQGGCIYSQIFKAMRDQMLKEIEE
jgi:hypothetical protein